MNKKNVYGVLFFILAAFSQVAHAEVIAYRFTFGPLYEGDTYSVPAGTNVYLAFDTADIRATGSNATYSFNQWFVLDARTKIGKLKITDAIGPNDNAMGVEEALDNYQAFSFEVNTNIGGKLTFLLMSRRERGDPPLYPYFGYTDPPVPLGYVAWDEFDYNYMQTYGPNQQTWRGRLTRWVSCTYRAEAKQPYRCPK